MSRAQHLSSSVCVFFNPTFSVKIIISNDFQTLCFCQERNKVICESNLQLPFFIEFEDTYVALNASILSSLTLTLTPMKKKKNNSSCTTAKVVVLMTKRTKRSSQVVKDDIRSCSSNSSSPWWTVADPLFCWNNIFVSNDDQVVELTFSKKQRFDKGPSAWCLKITKKVSYFKIASEARFSNS